MPVSRAIAITNSAELGNEENASWNNLNYAFSPDDNYSANANLEIRSKKLSGLGLVYDTQIPDNAVIISVTPFVRGYASEGATIRVDSLKWVIDSESSEELTPSYEYFPPAVDDIRYPDQTGTAWTPALINSRMTGFMFDVIQDYGTGGTAYVTFFGLEVEWELPEVTVEQTNELLYVKLNAQADVDPILTDAEIQGILQGCRIIDADGNKITDTGYTTTYDVTRAVAEAWSIKAAKASSSYAFSEAGLSLHREQVNEMCLKMAKQWAKKLAYTVQIDSPALDRGIQLYGPYSIIDPRGGIITRELVDPILDGYDRVVREE